MIHIQRLTKGFRGRTLFENVNWNLTEGERVGLTGPNGSGKTTLLRMFSGIESPDTGKIALPRGTSVGYLPQNGLTHQGKTVREETLTAFTKALAIGDEIKAL